MSVPFPDYLRSNTWGRWVMDERQGSNEHKSIKQKEFTVHIEYRIPIRST